MRVAVVTNLARSLVSARGRLIQRMVNLGHRVLAIAPDFTAETQTQLDQWQVATCPIVLERTGTNPLTDVKTAVQLARIYRREKVEVTFAYNIKPVVYSALAARWARTPRRYSLITGLGYAFGGREFKQRMLGLLVQQMYRFALRQDSAVIFQNRDDLELFRRLRLIRADCPTHVVNGSGVDLERFGCYPLPSGPIRVVMIARLLWEKGVGEFAAAARDIHRAHPEVQFGLVGPFEGRADAVRREDVRAWVQENVLEHTEWMDDVRPVLAKCHIFALPSYYREGIPRTALEALAVGRPIVTADSPGCREVVVGGENGFLVPPRDVSALAACIRQLVESPALMHRMAAASRRLAETRFDAVEVAERMVEHMGLAPADKPRSNRAV